MGFADKLRSTINKVTDTVQSAVDTAQSGYNPLPDDISKKYYEIAYGLLSSVYSVSDRYGTESIDYKEVHFDAIKKYIEFHLQEPCDDIKLLSILDMYFPAVSNPKMYQLQSDNILRKYVARDNNIPEKTISNLIKLNASLNLKKSYMCTKEEIYDICYKETIEKIKDEFNYIFKVVEEYNDCEYFDKGISEITKKYEKTMNCVLLTPLVNDLVYDSFWSGNPITKKCFLNKVHFEMYLAGRYNNENRVNFFSSFALRAVHFENYAGNKADYSSITDGECYDFIMNSKIFANSIKAHPFDIDDYIDKEIKEIKKVHIFKHLFGRSYEEDSPQNNYFIDYMCNLVWKEISNIYEGDKIEDKGEIANILYRFARTVRNYDCDQEI